MSRAQHCLKCAAAAERATEALGLLTDCQARVLALESALQGLFEHCVMVHKHWGDGDNTKQADAAQQAARAALEQGAQS